MAKTEVRNKLVKAAIGLYAKKGVAEVRLNQIAKAASVEPSLLKYHYPTLKSLHLEVIHFLLEELRSFSVKAIQKGKGSPYKSLTHYALAPLDWAYKYRGYSAIFIYFYHMAAVDKDYEDLITQIRNVGRDRIRLLIYKIRDSKKETISTSLDMDELAISIQSYMTGIAVMYSSEKGLKYQTCRRLVTDYVDQYLS